MAKFSNGTQGKAVVGDAEENQKSLYILGIMNTSLFSLVCSSVQLKCTIKVDPMVPPTVYFDNSIY